MLHTEFNFKRGKKKYHFDIVSNLDEIGLGIDAAFMNWSVRTDEFTEQSFCNYVKSKDEINIIAMPKKEFDAAIKSIVIK